MTTIFQLNNYRILEVRDDYYNLEDLKGDCYNPDLHPNINPEQLRQEELNFELQVANEGVFGYVLQVWNPDVDHGWEEIDSCWGFVGLHATHDHYIVGEFQDVINKLRTNK